LNGLLNVSNSIEVIIIIYPSKKKTALSRNPSQRSIIVIIETTAKITMMDRL